MAKVDALAQLKDIHLPLPIGWWPLAPGWYGVMILVLIVSAGIVTLVRRRRRTRQPKKQALALLQVYTAQYTQDYNAQLASARISELLKRVALVYYPRQQVASIHGQAWIQFLNQTGSKVDFEPVKDLLLDVPFKPNEQTDLQPLIKQAQLWIKQRKVPCLN